MKIKSHNIQNGGTLNTRKYDDRKLKDPAKYGILFEIQVWYTDILKKAQINETQIIENIKKIIYVITGDIDTVVFQEFQYQFVDFYIQELENKGFKFFEHSADLKINKARNGVFIASKFEIKRKNEQDKWPSKWNSKTRSYNFEYERRNFIEVEIEEYNILAIHVPSKDGVNRDYFKDKVFAFAQKNKNSKAIIIGDFNAATDNDRAKTSKDINSSIILKTLEENKIFLKNLENAGFKDAWRHLNPKVKEFTWYNNGNKNDGRRLDYAFVSEELQVELAKHEHDDNTTCNSNGISDHSALVIEVIV